MAGWSFSCWVQSTLQLGHAAGLELQRSRRCTRDKLVSDESVLTRAPFVALVVRPGATFVASDRSVRSDALCSVRSLKGCMFNFVGRPSFTPALWLGLSGRVARLGPQVASKGVLPMSLTYLIHSHKDCRMKGIMVFQDCLQRSTLQAPHFHAFFISPNAVNP